MSELAGSVDFTYAYRVFVLEPKQIMMKSKAAVYRTPLKVDLWLAVTSAGIFLNQSGLAAITFTNTPAAVSNTYTGTISLQIGGLTNAETVVIQKFLDANTNGLIDGADLLVQQFYLTDGANSIIGGGTNFHVSAYFNSLTAATTPTLIIPTRGF